MNKKILKITYENGNTAEYEILSAFIWMKTKKNYIIYTDNTYDIDNNLNIYASIYYPNDPNKLDTIETEEEWIEIEKRIENLK